MKKKLCFAIIIAFVVSLMSPAISSADSPITSTEFYVSYLDIDIVVKASKSNHIDEEIAGYLSDPENPLDVKAAVINALGWRFEGNGNADRYSDFIFGKPLEDLDFDSVPPHDLFCIGYLMVKDNYFEPERAIPVMEKACEAFPRSLTVAMIDALVKAQMYMTDDWSKMWPLVDDIIKNKDLDMDMRQEALDIIIDYMILYKEYSIQPDEREDEYSEQPNLKQYYTTLRWLAEIFSRIINGMRLFY